MLFHHRYSKRSRMHYRICGNDRDYGDRCNNPQTLPTHPTSPHPLNQRQRRLGVCIDHAQQRPRRGIGLAAVLLPISRSADWHAQALRELRLAEPGLGADRFDVRPGGDVAPAAITPPIRPATTCASHSRTA